MNKMESESVLQIDLYLDSIDNQIIELYFEDGLSEREIAESLGIGEGYVHMTLAEFENSDCNDYFVGD